MADNRIEIRVTASGAEQAAKILQDVAKQGGQLGSVTAAGAKQAEQALTGLGATAKRVFEVFTGVSLANITAQIAGMARQGISELTRMGLENQRVEESFTRMAASIGASSDRILSSLQAASRGIVDANDIMLSSSKALAQGLNPQQLENLMQTAVAQSTLAGTTVSEAFNAMAESVTNLNVKQLRSFGIVIDLDKAYESYAKTLGTTAAALTEAGRRAAIMQAIDEQTRKNRLALTAGELTQAQELEKAKAKWSDYAAGVASALASIYTELVKSSAKGIEWSRNWITWLDDTGAAWRRYYATTVLGQALGAAPPGPPMREREREAFREAAPGRGGATPFPVSADTAGHVDRTKAAALELDTALKLLNATFQAGITTGAEYEAGLVNQIAKMQALGKSLDDDGRVKLLNLMATLKQFREQNAQPISDIIAGVTSKLAEATGGGGAAAELDKIATALAKLPNLSKQSADAILAWAASMMTATTEAKRFSTELAAVAAAWEQHDLRLAQTGDTQNAWLATQQRMIDALQKQDEQMAAGAQSGSAYMDTLRKIAVEGADKAEASLRAMAEAAGLTGPAFTAAMLSATLLGKSFSELDESTKAWIARMAAAQTGAVQLKSALTFQDTLKGISSEAALVGSSFDAASAQLNAFKQRYLELAAVKSPTAEIVAEMAVLKQQFSDTSTFIQWRTTFEGIFNSVGDALNKLVTGVIQGTLSIGDAFKNLAQAIIINFVNTVIQQALNPLVKSFANFFAGLFSTAQQVGPAAVAAATGGGGGGGGFGGGGGGNGLGPFAPAGATTGGGFGGGGGNIISNIPVSAFNPSTWATVLGAAQGAISQFTLALESGQGIMTAVSAGWQGATSAFAGSVGALALPLAAVGAALAVYGTAMDLAAGNLEAGIGGIVGGIAGAIGGAAIGTWLLPGIGTAVGALAGGALGDWLGSMIGGLFGDQPSNYEIVRLKAQNEADTALAQLTIGFKDAITALDTSQLFQALQSGAGGASQNALRTELVLPASLAAEIGIQGQEIGGKIVAQWSSLTMEQFEQVLEAMKTQPGLIDMIRGSGDVAHLEGADAAEMATKIKDAAAATLRAFIEMEKIRDQINKVSDMLTDEIRTFLPEGIADAFVGQIESIRTQMLEALTSGLPAAEIQAAIDALESRMKALAGLAKLYATLEQDIVKLTIDLSASTANLIKSIEMAMGQADRAVERAQAGVAKADTAEEMLAAEGALRDAVMGRYALEMKLVQEIQGRINQLLEAWSAASGLEIKAARIQAEGGDLAGFNALYATFVNMARAGADTAERLNGVILGLATVASVVDLVVEHLQNAESILTPQGEVIPAEIWETMVAQAEPFFTELNDLISEALDAGDLAGGLALLQQEAALLQSFADQAVAAVNAWADAAIEATEKAADAMRKDINKNWDDLVDRINTVADAWIKDIDDIRDARVAGLEAEIKSIEDAAEARIDALDEEMEAIQEAAKAAQDRIADQIDALQDQGKALQKQIAVTREWESVVKSVGDYLKDLALGGFAKENPAEQAALGRQQLEEAFAAFRAAPTAEGAADIEKAAARLLPVAELAFSRPSAEFGAIFDRVTQILESVVGTATAEAGPLTSKQLEAQAEMLAERIEALQEQSQAIGEAAQAQAEAIREQIELTRESAADQVEEIRNTITAINDAADKEIKAIEDARDQALKDAKLGREHDLELVDLWEQAQKDAIIATRDDTVKAIGLELADKLKANAAEQKVILTELLGAQKEALRKIIGDEPLQAYMARRAKETVDQLILIQKDISAFVGVALAANTLHVGLTDPTVAAIGGAVGVATASMMPSASTMPSGGYTGIAAQTGWATDAWWDQWLAQMSSAATTVPWGGFGPGYTPPGSTPPPSAQHGARYTHAGLYRLHEGEMVLPRSLADPVRRGEGGGGGVSVTNHFHITGGDPEAIAKAIEARIEQSARFGRLGKIIREKS